MAKINIVLVEPEIPQNTGNVARTCSVTGAALHIVRPMGFTIDSAKLKRAGLDYWDKLEIHYYDSLTDFMDVNGQKPLVFFTAKSDRLYTECDWTDEAWLVFGKESVGLPDDLLFANVGRTARIPMIGDSRCLNMSNSVAVAVYEVLRSRGFAGMITKGGRIRDPNR
ncbi:MAG: tRNA (cytidine(34)-2'-O)-methyltransferase [Clostridia bacterium]|nr:tRNA (cytidine(34)-2'-O)-methyltransferase [Clostridia bacterium]